MKRLLPIVLFLFTTSSLFAQLTQLTTEANNAGITGSKPDNLVQLGTKILFVAGTSQYGREIWITDGTTAGTKLVKDIAIGPDGLSSISPFAVMNGKAYFCAQLDIGFQLWVTDGTTAGTKPVMARTFERLFSPVSDGTHMFFTVAKADAFNNVSSVDVWKSDGTDAGTVMIKGELDAVNGEADFLTFFDDLFFFTLADPVDVRTRLWRSDGTEEGTFVIRNYTGGDGSNDGGTTHPNRPLEYNGKLYLIIRDDSGDHNPFNVGLLETDGSEEGTSFIKGLWANGNGLIQFGEGIVYNDKMYFSFFNMDNNRFFICESDGTEPNTTIIYDHNFSNYFTPSTMLARDNSIYFTGGVDAAGGGVTLLKLDLDSKNTTLIKKVADTQTKPFFFLPRFANKIVGLDNGSFVFGIRINNTGGGTLDRWNIWTSDGTAGNTVMTDKIAVVTSTILTSDKIYWPAGTTADGQQLWTFDPAATQLKIADVGELGITTRDASVNNGKLLTYINDASSGSEPWITDGTVAGSHIVKNLVAGSNGSFPREITPLEDGFAFLGYLSPAGNNWTITKTDGTETGTTTGFEFVYPGSYPWNMFSNPDNTALYVDIEVRDGADHYHSLSILRENETEPTDLANLGVEMDVFANTLNGYAHAGNKTFFLAKGDFGGGGLWITDGSESGTKFLMEHWASSELTVAGSKAFYIVYDDEDDLYPALMISDGTEAGTFIIKDLASLNIRKASNFTAFGDKLVFSGIGDNGRELYISDGTSAGTKLIKDLLPGAGSGFRSTSIAVIGDSFYFAGDNGTTGIELFKSNGTAEGTALVKDISAGAESSAPQSLKALDGKLYFSARTADNGLEVWTSDGTPDNTKLLVDVVTGSSNGNPADFVKLNDYLIFTALTADKGRQYHSFKIEPVPPGEVTGLEGEKSLFSVYPNPSSGLFYIKSDLTNPFVEVYSSDGRRLHEGLTGDNQSIDLRSAAPGVYIVRVKDNVKTYSAKVLKR